MSSLTDKLQKQFAELNKRRDEILSVSVPLRQARDDFANTAREIELRMNATIKEAEVGLYEIDVDRATLARALGGKRMSDKNG